MLPPALVQPSLCQLPFCLALLTQRGPDLLSSAPDACLHWGDARGDALGFLPSQGTGDWLGISFLSTFPFPYELSVPQKGPSLLL